MWQESDSVSTSFLIVGALIDGSLFRKNRLCEDFWLWDTYCKRRARSKQPSRCIYEISVTVEQSHARAGREVWLCRMNSLGHCCGWCSCLSPADLLVHCCHLFWATSWFGRIWRGATPLFKSKLKTQSFHVQIYRSLFLSLALLLCFPSYSYAHREQPRRSIYVQPYATPHRRTASWWLLHGSTWDILAEQFKPSMHVHNPWLYPCYHSTLTSNRLSDTAV